MAVPSTAASKMPTYGHFQRGIGLYMASNQRCTVLQGNLSALWDDNHKMEGYVQGPVWRNEIPPFVRLMIRFSTTRGGHQ